MQLRIECCKTKKQYHAGDWTLAGTFNVEVFGGKSKAGMRGMRHKEDFTTVYVKTILFRNLSVIKETIYLLSVVHYLEIHGILQRRT